MIRGLTRAGLGTIESNEQFISGAAQFGFQAVDLNPVHFIRQCGREKAAHLLESKGVIIGSIDLDVDWRSSEERFREGLKALAEAAEAAMSLGCFKCCTYILPSTDEAVAPFMAAATRRLRLCADILGAFGIRLGLEFVGSRHLRTQWANPFLWRMDDTLDWIETIGARNVGLLVDSYHWYTNGLTVDNLLKLKPEHIVHVHINDAKAGPIENLLDADRLYPGEGVIDLHGFLQGLQTAGYSGVVAQEVLGPSTSESMEELLARSKAGFDKAFANL
ncbi:sugar phosphate isomerase/epimerase family protein [Ktedonobacter racemifer]|uniref:Xylose isomerase domain protein TIM barrel n=1 Tax=Ktedonobacter racemifer DSM 44963 TaxID=485913 RepID=D6TW62_KTERA|nr:sugar phosphate isomerase/epimerase [Ktedonobacter racemifer]EFH84445.1 Xylose isomerase domain protein TIM barrel [Ktedonobacter racemifer DSM 44963]